MNLRGYTRGRGPNPLKRKTGTLGSRTLLEYPSSQPLGKPLNYESMKIHYRKYFGLLLALLYSSKQEAHSQFKPFPPLVNQKKPIIEILRPLLKKKGNKSLGLSLDEYNQGSKINALFLQANGHPKDDLLT
jgi:hypothetical protein